MESITSRLAMILLLSLVLLIGQNVEGLRTGFVNGIYTVFCDSMCYDLIKNSNTKGYDTKFLSMPKVKDTCIDANKSGFTMGFCDKSLGTL